MTIEGIPEGYELARIGTPNGGELYLTPKGRIEICEGGFEGNGYAVLRKIKKETRVVEITRWITLCKSWVNGEYLLHLVVDKQHLAKDCPEPQLHTFRFEVAE